jgi:hypothetical protein
MVTVPEVSVAAVNEPEPTWAATLVGVPPVMVKVTTVGDSPEPPPLPVGEPPQPTTSARTPQRAEKRRTAKDHCFALSNFAGLSSGDAPVSAVCIFRLAYQPKYGRAAILFPAMRSVGIQAVIDVVFR